MRKQSLFLFLMLSVSVMLLVIPASAAEVTINFDGRSDVVANQPLTTQYAAQGVVFEGTTVVVTDSTGDLGIAPARGSLASIMKFNPYVTRVSIQFEDARSAVMAGVTVNGRVLLDSEKSVNGDTLEISSSADNPIKDVAVASLELKKVQFDNLSYSQVPEFPTAALPVAAVLGLLFIFQRRKN